MTTLLRSGFLCRMKIDKFNAFWQDTYHPLAMHVKKFGTRLCFDTSKREPIYDSYEQYRKQIHNEMGNKKDLLDRHKVASALTYAILFHLPFEIKRTTFGKIAKKVLLANEIFAFSCGLRTVSSFITSDKGNSADVRNVFLQQYQFPRCSRTHRVNEVGESYLTHIARMLYCARKTDTHDLFTLSHLYFMIESYHLLRNGHTPRSHGSRVTSTSTENAYDGGI